MSLLLHLIRTVLGALLTLALLLALGLALLHAAPGGPFEQEKLAPPEVIAALEARFLLDQPFWRQYTHYLGHALRGDLGPSYHYLDFDVAELLGPAALLTVSLGLGALALGVGLAVGGALLAARRPEGLLDRLLGSLGAVLMAMPKFVTAPLLVLVFAIGLRWLPAGGIGSGRGLILPLVALALPIYALAQRVLRAALLDALSDEAARAARARGLGPSALLWRHALPQAWPALAGVLAPLAIAVLTGSAVVEQVFALPGLGRYLVQGALNRDYPLVLGVILIAAVITLTVSVLADLMLRASDPRLR